MLFAAKPLMAQGPGGSLPPIEIDNVIVEGKRMVVLPKARKGEVSDTSRYVLPAGDSLLFAERISNLTSAGGALPGYREFEPPLRLDAEASMGSYLSPRLMVGAEYVRSTYDVAGLIDLQNTAGHVDNADATSILAGVRGSVLVGSDLTPLGRFRLLLAADYGVDSYNLYGTQAPATERTRTAGTVQLGMRGEGNTRLHYAFGLEVADVSVADQNGDTAREATALAPTFNLELGYAIDSAVDARAHLNFASTSLRYATAAQTPAFLSILGEVEWRPSPGLSVTGGLLFANGENSDSGAVTLIAPRLAGRMFVNDDIVLFAWFAPELRAASYRERVMWAPYADRDIQLHPERMPVNLSFGVNVNGLFGGSAQHISRLNARAFYQISDGTPVVDAIGGGGIHMWRNVDAKRLGVEASLTMPIGDAWKGTLDVTAQSATLRSDDEPLPMTPSFDLRARVDHALPLGSQELNLYATARFTTEQQTFVYDGRDVIAPVPTPLAAHFLVGCGAAYQLMANLEAFVDVTNLLGQHYDLWQNYSAPGFEIRGGLRVTL